jgi:hypothetical protein
MLDDVGGMSSVFTAVSFSGSAPLLSGTASPSSGSSRPRHSPAAARRRRRGTQPAPPRFSFPGPLPSCGGTHTRMGKTPTRVGEMRLRPRGSPIGSRSRQCRGKDGRGCSYWWPWRGGRRGVTSVVAGRLWRHRARAKGSIPPGGFPWTGSLVRASLGVRANSPQPSHPARGTLGGAVELEAERGKVEEDRDEGG